MKLQLKRYIANTRDCDVALLDIAINKGVLRAKNEGLDHKKIIKLAAMCAATTALCIILSSDPVRLEIADLLLNNSMVTQSDSQALYDYLNSITSALKTYFGGN